MKKTITRTFRFVSCVILIAVVFTGCTGADKTASANTFARVYAFRLLASEDYKNALSKSASTEVQKKFDSFDEAMWPSMKPADGWSYFFNTSLMVFGKNTPSGWPVAFYNPWSDVYLVTLWKMSEDKKPRMVDAELMMGDLFRQRGKKPDKPSRMWDRSDVYLPAAVGIATARSVKSFEDAFTIGDASQWRKNMPGLDEQSIDAGRYGAGFLMLQNLNEIAAFPVGTTSHPVPDDITAAILKAFADIRSGNMVPVIFETQGTLPETRKTLSQMDVADWNAFRLVAFQSSGERAMVVLADAANPSLFMAMLFERKDGKAALSRIDLLDFHAFYAKTPETLLKEES